MEEQEIQGKMLEETLSSLSVVLNEGQIKQFLQYYELLVTWNGFMNLTAITEYEDVIKKHFADSLSLIRVWDVRKEAAVIDVGTGAGFPGIPLKIAFPQLKITLLDSLRKRVKFLNEVIDVLGLEQIEAIHGRAEDFAKPERLRERYDLCVSRAVANLSVLSELCLPFVKIGGSFISYKSGKAEVEFADAKRAVSLLGGEMVQKESFSLPGTDYDRTLLVIAKKKATPKKYPRKAGLPSKEPIC